MDDEEDMTLNQLATCQIENNNDVTTGVLSTGDCNMKDSVETDRLKDNITHIKEYGKDYEGRK